MTVYFMGGEMAGLVPSDASSYEYSGGTEFFNSAFARCTTYCGTDSASQYVSTPTLSLPDDFFLHFEFTRPTTAAGDVVACALNNGGTDVFRVIATNANFQMQRWTGAAWSNVGSTVSYAVDSRQIIDLQIVGNDASGSATLYLSGTLRETATADLTSVVSIDTVRFYGTDLHVGTFVSQVIIADTSTIGKRLGTRYPNGAGTTGDWTGAYTDVDEIVYDDADFAYSASADQVELYTQTGPDFSGYVPVAVAVYARAKRGASGPQNLQLALRVNGTTYFSGNKALGLGYDSYGHIWETNPDTTGAWTGAQLAALQPGVKSIA